MLRHLLLLGILCAAAPAAADVLMTRCAPLACMCAHASKGVCGQPAACGGRRDTCRHGAAAAAAAVPPPPPPPPQPPLRPSAPASAAARRRDKWAEAHNATEYVAPTLVPAKVPDFCKRSGGLYQKDTDLQVGAHTHL